MKRIQKLIREGQNVTNATLTPHIITLAIITLAQKGKLPGTIAVIMTAITATVSIERIKQLTQYTQKIRKWNQTITPK